MNFDCGIAKNILRQVSDHPATAGCLEWQAPVPLTEETATWLTHSAELIDEGYLIGRNYPDEENRPSIVVVERITQKGRDFLKALETDGFMDKVKKAAADWGGKATLAIVTALARKYIGG